MRRKITIAIDKELLRKARELAIKRGTSVSRLLAGELERLVGSADAQVRARDAALAEIDHGLRLGGRPAPRDALHER